jgi:hypothetical protein
MPYRTAYQYQKAPNAESIRPVQCVIHLTVTTTAGGNGHVHGMWRRHGESHGRDYEYVSLNIRMHTKRAVDFTGVQLFCGVLPAIAASSLKYATQN